MTHIKSCIFLAIVTMMMWSLHSCKRDLDFTSDDLVYFSVDSLHFDTAFTTTTSRTRKVLIYNRSNKSIKINRLYVEKGALSYFHFGIDALTGQEVSDLVILPNDSSYLFVSVTIDSNSDNLPFLVSDRIIAETDAGSSSMIVDAYGQNAVFYQDTVLNTITWTDDLPVVLLGNVEIAEGQTLTINPGVKIYTQSKKYLIISGSIQAIGTKEDSIIFQGARLDRDYFGDDDAPGEWGGIYLTPSSEQNEMEHVIIKNAIRGIIIDSLARNNDFKLKINKSTIFNCLSYGIYALQGSVDLRNCYLISSNVNLAILRGGELYMNHCTLGGYSVRFNQHSEPNRSISMAVLNYFIDNNVITEGDLEARILNSIIYGSLDQEAVLDSVQSSSYYLELRNNVIKTNTPLAELMQLATVYENNILNENPNFEDTYEVDYTFGIGSPCYRATSTFSLPDDINDRLRSTPTDIGCEEMN